MGPIGMPTSGRVYVDTPALIYTIEAVPDYRDLLGALWEAAGAGSLSVVSSELALLETLVVPLREGNRALQAAYEEFLLRGDVRLLPIDQATLCEAARLRATTSLRTPDAIHVATSTLASCTAFLTNDRRLGSCPGVRVLVLADML